MEVRNAPGDPKIGSLREADWRLLIPEPANGAFEHLLLLGAGTGVAERLIQDGIARRVTTDPGGGLDAADAIVVLGRAARRLSIGAAARLLMPGGSLYLEVDRRAHGWALTPGRVCRALEASGLTPTGTYWVRPTFETRQTYVPLDVSGPLEWYLGTAYTSPGVRERLLGTAMRACAHLNHAAAGALARRYAVTAIAGNPRDSVIAALARRALPALARSSRIVAILNTNGADEKNRVVILPFESNLSRPAAVLKSSRSPSLNYLAEVEQSSMERMRAALDAAMRETLPAPLGVTYWGQIAVGAESYLDGEVLARVCRRRSAPVSAKVTAFRQAVEWLTEFNDRAQVARPAWSEALRHEYIDPLVELYRAAYGLTPGERDLLGRLEERSRAIVGTPVPIVWQHYAYAPWNITRLEGRIRVFDWEGAVPNLPLYDLLYFAIRWYEDVKRLRGGAAQTEAFRQLFCASDEAPFYATLVDGAIDEYLGRLGIDPRFRAIGLTTFAFARAVSHLEGVPPEERAGLHRTDNRRRELVGLLVEHQEKIFAEMGVPAEVHSEAAAR